MKRKIEGWTLIVCSLECARKIKKDFKAGEYTVNDGQEIAVTDRFLALRRASFQNNLCMECGKEVISKRGGKRERKVGEDLRQNLPPSRLTSSAIPQTLQIISSLPFVTPK